MSFPEITLDEPVTYPISTSSDKETKTYRGDIMSEYLSAKQMRLVCALLFAEKDIVPTLSILDQPYLWKKMSFDQSSTDVSVFEVLELFNDIRRPYSFEHFSEDTLFDNKLPDLPVSVLTVKVHFKFEGKGEPDFHSELADE
jgi:hypothetical protein